jgi:hypothetical protein
VSQGDQIEALLEAAAPAPAAEEEFQFGTLPPEISFQTARVPPPAWLYVGPDDRLRIEAATSITGVTLRLDVRLLLPNGEINSSVWTFGPTGNRAINTWWVTLAEAFLLSVFASTDSAVPPGACWVRCLLVRGGGSGASLAQAIVAGYLAQRSGLAWPYPRYQNPVEGAGRLRLIDGTDPAPGVSIAETVPVGARWKLVSVFCWLATSALAGDRHVYLQLMSPAGIWLWIPPALAQPASQTYYYSWAIGINPYTSSIVGLVARPLPDQLTLTPGQQFMVQATGMLAGDDFGPPRYLVEEWVEP